ncbi:non-hydrolyzing UDP-N-acetylglucosamine 2-epimerase [Anaerotignum lactatifermentans]|uniref:non-hydrolyzing UDP-N-acetylglucosamine 2-epimerase n=1 Tax=Anaerotignum lactatifermentans TaxID=160404 RepID=UPI0019616D6C
MEKIKVMSVFGTRPEAIKMAPLVKVLEASEEIESVVCVTAQHREMLDQVLEIFDLHPKYDLDIMQSRQSLAGITTRALTGLEEVMAEEKPDIVLVHGDTSTTFAGALAAYYNQVKVGHVEAGLRTYDKYQPFPEEMNRRLTGALTDLHFAPTRLAKEHLLKENVAEDGIFITGNTVIDALAHTIEEDYTFHEEVLNSIDFKGKRVIAMTAHRRENLGEPLRNICHAVKRIVEEFPDVEVVYAVHKNPAVQEVAREILGSHDRIHLTDPLDLKDMHNLMCRSFFVMTDSGGLQEEVPSMGKPVLVLRNVTERPEGVEAGTLKLAGTEEETVYAMAKELLTDKEVYEAMAQAKNPFGDGNASKRIRDAILYAFGRTQERPADYWNTEQNHRKEGNDMKEERMAILNMLEKGLITVDEAERLLIVLQNGMGMDKDGIGKAVGGALEKAGAMLGSVAKTVGEKAEQLQPRVREVATKVADKADEMQPTVRSVAFRMTEKAQELKEDARNYKEKLRAKKYRDEEEDWDDEDLDQMDAAEAELAEQAETPAAEETDPEMEKYAKNVEAVMSSVQLQMEQIDECEDFLKAAFGDVDLEDLEDEGEKKEDVPAEEKKDEEA